MYKPRRLGRGFAELLDAVAAVDPELRVRFTSPHPKDFSDDVIEVPIGCPQQVLRPQCKMYFCTVCCLDTK